MKIKSFLEASKNADTNKNGTIINEGEMYQSDILIEAKRIKKLPQHKD